MIDLKVLGSTLSQLEEERGVPRKKIIEAIEQALAAAYKKDYGKRGQIIQARFNLNTGTTEFSQVKIVVDKENLQMAEDEEVSEKKSTEKSKSISSQDDVIGDLIRFNPERHILLEDAQKIKKDTLSGEELIFPLEGRDDYGRIAAQTAKQVIIQKIREAEKTSVLNEYGKKQGTIVSGSVQRTERGTMFIDLDKTTGIISYDEQIPGERYRQGERIRAYLCLVEETQRGVHLRLSRSHPKFIEKLFEVEVPEIANKTVEIKAVAREAGSRSKIAVISNDEHIDPVGSCVGQRGVRVSTITSELGGEKIDVIEWSKDPERFIEDALSPAKIMDITLNESAKHAIVKVSEDQLSLAIGKGGQNVRLAAKLTNWKIDIQGERDNTQEENGVDEESTEQDAASESDEFVKEETSNTDMNKENAEKDFTGKAKEKESTDNNKKNDGVEKNTKSNENIDTTDNTNDIITNTESDKKND